MLNQCSQFFLCSQWITQTNAQKWVQKRGPTQSRFLPMGQESNLYCPSLERNYNFWGLMLIYFTGVNPGGCFCIALQYFSLVFNVGILHQSVCKVSCCSLQCLMDECSVLKKFTFKNPSQDPVISRSDTAFSFSVHASIHCPKGTSRGFVKLSS